MIQREKRYVEVDVRFSTEGRLRPLQIIFDKGQVYKIDKIKDICRRAADVGGVGDRYICMIQGKERELWFEDGRWFVAAKVVNEKIPAAITPRGFTRYVFSLKKTTITCLAPCSTQRASTDTALLFPDCTAQDSSSGLQHGLHSFAVPEPR